MTQTNDSTSQPSSQYSLGKRMIIGAVIALAAISFFVFGVDHPKPEWGKFWMIKPLLLTPLAGAMCGLSNYVIMTYYKSFGINRIVAIAVSVVVCLVGLWLGIVLGLNGTMWN